MTPVLGGARAARLPGMEKNGRFLQALGWEREEGWGREQGGLMRAEFQNYKMRSLHSSVGLLNATELCTQKRLRR